MKKTLILLAGCLLGAGAFASCYTVVDAKGNTVSESTHPPVDMARHLHETVPEKYGEGATMIFGIADADCGDHVTVRGDDGMDKQEAASATQEEAAPVKPETVTAKQSKRAAHPARTRHKPQTQQPPQPK